MKRARDSETTSASPHPTKCVTVQELAKDNPTGHNLYLKHWRACREGDFNRAMTKLKASVESNYAPAMYMYYMYIRNDLITFEPTTKITEPKTYILESAVTHGFDLAMKHVMGTFPGFRGELLNLLLKTGYGASLLGLRLTGNTPEMRTVKEYLERELNNDPAVVHAFIELFQTAQERRDLALIGSRAGNPLCMRYLWNWGTDTDAHSYFLHYHFKLRLPLGERNNKFDHLAIHNIHKATWALLMISRFRRDEANVPLPPHDVVKIIARDVYNSSMSDPRRAKWQWMNTEKGKLWNH